MNKYKILIFDLDDTLIDNLENVRHAFTKMIETQDEYYNDNNFKRWYKLDKQFWKDWQDGLIELPEELKNEIEYLKKLALPYFSNDGKNTVLSKINNNVNIIYDDLLSCAERSLNKDQLLIIIKNNKEV